ncbi:transcription elongation factor subunit Spt4 [Candidatus Nanohalovita haloferacivicina]|uniref:transcription elongation factor subunit Spt4 n=1 Tax=Candidatus Nanohalovita haloferacivicina TaxID=2978046 RepID=UPI00325FAE9E|nr:DNA-directed RNA polymerase subunit E'' [Candidatus Nanohalobia archaeon BNXNv]
MAEKACKNCNRIVEDATECPVCKNNDLSDSWSGLVVIYDPEDSQIAEKIGINTPGKYAIRVK